MPTEMVQKEDVAWPLARNITAVRYEDIPQEAVATAKKSVLDILGVILGASGTIPGIKELVELIEEWGGKEESTIIPFGIRVPAWAAAFTNGSMVHGLDYDDMDHFVRVHSSSSVVPAAFAIAERLGNVTGKELITAVVLGQDLMVRLGSSIPRPVLDWHKTSLCGAFAATAASGKLLQLDTDRMVDAFGIALCQASGTQELRFAVENNLGGMRDAFPAKTGVLSALMAQKGISGIKTCFEGRAAFFNVFFNGQYDRDPIIANLGKTFAGINTGYKPWPACGMTHIFIEGTLGIMSEQDIHPGDIQEIVIHVSEDASNLCQPIDGRRKPEAILDAKFSLPFTVAVAATKGDVLIGDYTTEEIKNPAVLQMAEKVTPKLDPQFNPDEGGMPTGQVEIHTKGGKTFQKRMDFPLGHAKNPLPMERLVQKFRDCCAYSAKPIKQENIERVIELVTKLEGVDNVSQIMRLLT